MESQMSEGLRVDKITMSQEMGLRFEKFEKVEEFVRGRDVGSVSSLTLRLLPSTSSRTHKSTSSVWSTSEFAHQSFSCVGRMVEPGKRETERERDRDRGTKTRQTKGASSEEDERMRRLQQCQLPPGAPRTRVSTLVLAHDQDGNSNSTV